MWYLWHDSFLRFLEMCLVSSASCFFVSIPLHTSLCKYMHIHTYAYAYTGNYHPSRWKWTEAVVLMRCAAASQSDSQRVQKAMERLPLPCWQTGGRETEHWIRWGTEPGRAGWEDEAESGDRDYYYKRNKIFFYLRYLNPFIRDDMKESIALKQFLQLEAQRQAESCNPEDYFQRERHETSVCVSGDGKSAFRLSEKTLARKRRQSLRLGCCHVAVRWIYLSISPNKRTSMFIDIVDMNRKL